MYEEFIKDRVQKNVFKLYGRKSFNKWLDQRSKKICKIRRVPQKYGVGDMDVLEPWTCLGVNIKSMNFSLW